MALLKILPAYPSRRGMIKTLGLGLTLANLPAFVSAGMTEIDADSLDPGERVIPVTEKDLVEMQQFIEDCIAASRESDPQQAVREVLARGVSDAKAMLKAVGDPTEAGLKVFLRSENLTIFAASWTPQMNLMPHNHRMWANIGIYTGREDNILWDRKEQGLQATRVACLFPGDVAALNAQAIHSVTNPLRKFTGGIHIYGGDFFATQRSQWDPETLQEGPSDGEAIQSIFREANQQWLRQNRD